MNGEHIEPIDYVMDALDDVARRRADQHLASCARCRAEVAEWRESTAKLALSTDPVEPPPALRDSVLTRTADLPQEHPPETPAHDSTSSPARRRPSRVLLAAAAAVVLIAGGITVATKPWQSNPTTISGVERVEHAPDAQRTTAAVEGGSLVMVVSKTQQKAVATLQDVRSAANGKAYQAWFVTPSGMIDAGLLQPGQPTVLKGSISGVTAAAVTVEPAGGSKQPTTKPIVHVSMK